MISSQPGQDKEVIEAAGDKEEILLAVRRWLDLLQRDPNLTG
ncbi:hypothetical protein [Arthrobacter sp. Cr_A7]|nr:hypothetical protein [Arthrobacter sp. Cr_A7]MDF2051767.1 hypothetical protein [Arthrobacter sp. Cr_A7]